MSDVFAWLLSAQGYMPHGHCYLWQPGTLWLNVGSDGLIAAAYFAIPVTLFSFVRRRMTEIPFPGILLMFASFILLCGMTHVMEIWTVWNPAYRFSGALKLVTGIVSLITTVTLVRLIPLALQLRSPEALQREVQARTAELAEANATLRRAIEELNVQREQLDTTRGEKTQAQARLETTLRSVGDAVISTDATGVVQFMNTVAEALTGWREQDARGRLLPEVFHIVNEQTRDTVESPVDKVLREGAIVGLANHTVLIARDSTERPIEDSGAPIMEGGKLKGVVLVFRDATTQRTAQRALLESERRHKEAADEFAGLADNVDQLVWMAKPDGAIFWYNKRWYDYTGTTPEAMQGWGWQSVHDPRELPTVLERWQQSIARQAPFDMVFPLKGADGKFREFLTRIVPIKDQAGQLVRWFGTNTDISELRRAEAALHQREEQLRLATEAAEVGLWDVDLITDTLFWPPRVKAMFGISPDVPVSMADFFAGLHPEDIAQVGEAYAAAADPKRRSLYDVEYRTIGKEDKIVRWIAAKGRGVFDEKGNCIRTIGTAIDITRRKADEQKLRYLNENLEREIAMRIAERDRLWNNAQDLQVVIDSNGVFRAVNPAVTAILGWTPEEMTGRTVFEFIHAEDLSATRGALVTATSNELPLFENRYRHKGGGYRTLAWVAAPENDLIYASGRDVTEERQRELELSEAQERLRQSQKMEAVGQLTGGIAHDFNNLLVGITGSLELLQRRVAAGRFDGLERYASTAITSAQRAAALTQRLLAFARRQPLDPKRVEGNRLVAGMEDLLRRTLGPSIDLEMVMSGGLWPTLCDPNQLESALLNLAINSRDAMPEGGRLTIETGNAHLDEVYARSQAGEVQAGQYVSIAVTDTGVGMPPDVIDKAFDPFFTTKPLGQGTGLGLSMLYGFMKQSQGHVRVYSEVGKGTTFRLYLPRLREALATEMPESPLPSLIALSAEEGETVLVVDDEAAVRMLVSETLEGLGYAAIEAGESKAALRVLESAARIDLLITDVGLPGLNGRQIADAARVVRPQLKVLFMTGYAHNAAIGNSNALERGMRIITKPFTLDALARIIREMIEEK